jgi:hypothetical protein
MSNYLLADARFCESMLASSLSESRGHSEHWHQGRNHAVSGTRCNSVWSPFPPRKRRRGMKSSVLARKVLDPENKTMRALSVATMLLLIPTPTLAASPTVESALNVLQAVGADANKLKAFCQLMKLDEN